MTYHDQVDDVAAKFTDSVLNLLNTLSLKAKESCQVGPVKKMTDDQHTWFFYIHPKPVPADQMNRWHDSDLCVELVLEESLHNEGSQDGVNFSLAFQANGGRTYQRYMPENYTEKVWVPFDQNELQERFNKIVKASEPLLLYSLEEHLCKLSCP